MTIEATVVGIRLYSASKNARRELNLEWSEPTTDESPFPMTYTMHVTDNNEEFDLGDVVKIELSFVRRVE